MPEVALDASGGARTHRALIDRMVEGTQAQAGGRSIRELERLRDDYLVAIQQVLRQYDIGAGSTLRALEERLYADRRGARPPCGTRSTGRATATGEAAGPNRATGVDRLQRPHDRFALPAGVRRCDRRSVALAASMRLTARRRPCSRWNPRHTPGGGSALDALYVRSGC